MSKEKEPLASSTSSPPAFARTSSKDRGGGGIPPPPPPYPKQQRITTRPGFTGVIDNGSFYISVERESKKVGGYYSIIFLLAHHYYFQKNLPLFSLSLLSGEQPFSCLLFKGLYEPSTPPEPAPLDPANSFGDPRAKHIHRLSAELKSDPAPSVVTVEKSSTMPSSTTNQDSCTKCFLSLFGLFLLFLNDKIN